jgi:tetratricopeptide (TPR) repeat protein
LRGLLAYRADPLWLVLLGALVYANSIDNPFVFDDQILIADNLSIRQLWPPNLDLRPEIPLSSRPLIRLSLALNYAVDRLNPASFRLANIGVHLLAGLTLLGVLRRTLERFCGGGIPRRHTRGLAFAAAAIWLVHPLNSETINYVAQRSESVMGLFYLLALYCAVRRFDQGGDGWTILAGVSALLGMASKEVMVTAPLMILIYDRIFVSPSWLAALTRHRRLYAGLFFSWVVLAALLTVGAHGETVGFGRGVTAYTYALNQTGVIARYLGLSVWPYPLLVDYGFANPELTLWAAAPGLLSVVALLGLMAWALKVNPRLGFAGIWFFLILVPTSSFVPIVSELGAERRIYLPLAGLVAAVVMLAYDSFSRRRSGPLRVGPALVAVCVLLLVLATRKRNRDYATEIGIWQTVVAAAPHNYRGHNNLGFAFKRSGLLDLSIPHFENALRLNPNYVDAHYNLGTALSEKDQADEGEWHLRRALALDPHHARSHHGLALMLRSQGWLTEAISHHRHAVWLEPTNPSRGHGLGIALATAGHLDSALVWYRHTLELEPGFYEAHNNLGIALRKLDRPRQAIAHYRWALELNPRFADAHYNLANALGDIGDSSAARYHYLEALDINPGYAKAHNNIGKLLGSKGMIAAGIDHFSKALELNPNYAEAHFNLGTAYLLEDYLEAAVAHYRRAVELDANNPVWLQHLSRALRRQVELRTIQRQELRP